MPFGWGDSSRRHCVGNGAQPCCPLLQLSMGARRRRSGGVRESEKSNQLNLSALVDCVCLCIPGILWPFVGICRHLHPLSPPEWSCRVNFALKVCSAITANAGTRDPLFAPKNFCAISPLPRTSDRKLLASALGKRHLPAVVDL